jgi:hypothetical protein
MNIVRVYRWISKKDKILYTFGQESDNPDIPIVIFQDDSLNKAITKIAAGIVQYHNALKEPIPSIDAIPYIWSNKKSLRFDFLEKQNNKKLQNTIPVNPWDVNLSNIDDLKAFIQTTQISYNQDLLFKKNDINIVFKNDISSKLYPYYFPDYKITWKPKYSLKELIKESTTLSTLWNIDTDDIEDYQTFIFSKVRFIGSIKYKPERRLLLSEIFNTIHTSQQIPFIQYIEDSSRILYKLWKKHTISPQLIQTWSFYDRLPKVEMIILMIPLDREDTFARATLDTNCNISIQYQIDSRDKITWDTISTFTLRIKKWFEQVLLTSISFRVDSISGKGEFAAQGISIQDVSKNIGKSLFIPLYHIIRLQDGILYIAFKRSQNYHNQLDISDYISSNIKLGIPLQDIAQYLIDLGLNQKDVLLWIEQYQSQTDNDITKKKSISFTGCVLKIDKSPYGFRISMEKCNYIR